jgi:hypothetical protein
LVAGRVVVAAQVPGGRQRAATGHQAPAGWQLGGSMRGSCKRVHACAAAPAAAPECEVALGHGTLQCDGLFKTHIFTQLLAGPARSCAPSTGGGVWVAGQGRR